MLLDLLQTIYSVHILPQGKILKKGNDAYKPLEIFSKNYDDKGKVVTSFLKHYLIPKTILHLVAVMKYLISP